MVRTTRVHHLLIASRVDLRFRFVVEHSGEFGEWYR